MRNIVISFDGTKTLRRESWTWKPKIERDKYLVSAPPYSYKSFRLRWLNILLIIDNEH